MDTRSRTAPLAPLFLALLAGTGCAVTSHPAQRSRLGVARSSAELLAVLDQPGPVQVETVNSADWEVPLSGLVDLDHARAREAGLQEKLEPIQVYFHALRHPTRGLFLVDTGVERALRDDPEHAALRGLVASEMHFERMKFRAPLGDWLAGQKEPLRGVLMTHLHLDHLSGMPDVPNDAPVYTGPGEAQASRLIYAVVQPNSDRALAGKGPLEEWPFAGDAQGRFAGVLDVFGDGSVWALWTPGHTPGSTAYLVRTPSGPVLLTGDTSHTRWGWEHEVAPGSYTSDHEKNQQSLAALRKLVSEHPSIEVRLGHQR